MFPFYLQLRHQKVHTIVLEFTEGGKTWEMWEKRNVSC